MDWLLNLYKVVEGYAQMSPVTAGALSIMISGGIGFVLYKAPRRIMLFFNNTLFVTFEINNAGFGKSQVTYINILRWFHQYEGFKFTRNYSFESSNWDGVTATGAGTGNHFILYNGAPLYWRIYDLDSSGSEKVKRAIRVRTPLIFRKKFLEFVKEVTSDDNCEFKAESYSYDFTGQFWRSSGEIPNRSIDTVVLNAGVMESLVEVIEEFNNREEWYRTNGIPYKLVILLYGPPGTGKSSIIKALAKHFNRNICSVFLHATGDQGFVKCIESVPKRSFIVMEDIDTSGSVKSRADDNGSDADNFIPKEKPKDPVSEAISEGGLNFSTVINTIDGVVELNDKIIFLTTNHPEKLDKALYRSSRVDCHKLIDYLDGEAINRYAEMVFPDDYNPLTFPKFDKPVPGSVLQEILLGNKFDYNGFVSCLKERVEKDEIVVNLSNVQF